jgi:hypothetical protein
MFAGYREVAERKEILVAEGGFELRQDAGSKQVEDLLDFLYPELEHSPTSYLTRCGYAHVGDGTSGSLRAPIAPLAGPI